MVFIAGFPKRIGADQYQLNPVVQTGVIAMIDSIEKYVLIDIEVNKGNSGSPAFVVNNGGKVELIGVVVSFRKRGSYEFEIIELKGGVNPDGIPFNFEGKDMLAVPFPANSGLGGIFPLIELKTNLIKLIR